ncbi:MAG: hypothetical protein K6U04_02710 [Armatimonadetes bacterium]|nr:hypothetical protein [Armatimonadota bacterium]
MKRQLTRMQKILILIVALSGGFYFYLNKVYDPVMKEYKKSSQELRSLREEVASQEMAAGSSLLEEKIRKKKKEAAELENNLNIAPVFKKAQAENEVTGAVTEINRLAFACGMDLIELKSVSAQAEKDARPAKQAEKPVSILPEGASLYNWQEYRLVLEGDPGGLARFGEALMKSEYLILIKNLKIDAGAKTAGKDAAKAGGPVITIELLI